MTGAEADRTVCVIWICPECGEGTASYPPYALCSSVKPHENYKMERFEFRLADLVVAARARVSSEGPA